MVSISRAAGTVTYPCNIMLVAAMNPCPCGHYGDDLHPCHCSERQIINYLSRVSGPMLDRIDLHVEVSAVRYENLTSTDKSESSSDIKKRVDNARNIQRKRYENLSFSCNANLPEKDMQTYCTLTDNAKSFLKTAFDKLGMSARAYDRILKVSRTIADLSASDMIDVVHIAEAVQYRSLDRKYWHMS